MKCYFVSLLKSLLKFSFCSFLANSVLVSFFIMDFNIFYDFFGYRFMDRSLFAFWGAAFFVDAFLFSLVVHVLWYFFVN